MAYVFTEDMILYRTVQPHVAIDTAHATHNHCSGQPLLVIFLVYHVVVDIDLWCSVSLSHMKP